MLDFHQKRKLRTILTSRYTQGFLVFLILIVGWSAYTRYEIAADMEERRLKLETEAATLEERKNELQKQVEYLSHERGIEAEMRRQFDVALDGEQVVVIVEEETEEEIQPLSSSSTKKGAWYEFWR